MNIFVIKTKLNKYCMHAFLSHDKAKKYLADHYNPSERYSIEVSELVGDLVDQKVYIVLSLYSETCCIDPFDIVVTTGITYATKDKVKTDKLWKGALIASSRDENACILGPDTISCSYRTYEREKITISTKIMELSLT